MQRASDPDPHPQVSLEHGRGRWLMLPSFSNLRGWSASHRLLGLAEWPHNYWTSPWSPRADQSFGRVPHRPVGRSVLCVAM
jgi:hypothetical protein